MYSCPCSALHNFRFVLKQFTRG
uniref:Uncharacterized protein n=1 Tax=Anguilla anguilla TaxID=7936 RepID=A0A0E9VYH7_ANGAN